MCNIIRGYEVTIQSDDSKRDTITVLKNSIYNVLPCQVMRLVRYWVKDTFPPYPGNHKLLYYHADGGPKLIDQKLTTYLLKTVGCNRYSRAQCLLSMEVQNSRKTLAMLAESGFPKSFWLDAYVAACEITRMIPTRTCRGQSVCRVPTTSA